MKNSVQLLEWGFPSGKEFGIALKRMSELQSRGESNEKIRSVVFELTPPKKKPMRRKPASYTKAIEVENDLDTQNVTSVDEHMNALLKCPVIERGSIMPDACPVGSKIGTIPVGGCIEVKDAIIPAAHSADICCSMYATFFRSTLLSKTIIDKAADQTRFGVGGRKEEDWVHHSVIDEDVWENPFLKGLEVFAQKHIADQGDGNHFLFLGKLKIDQKLLIKLHAINQWDLYSALSSVANNEVYALVTHHGSRGLGAQVYKRGMKAAQKLTNLTHKEIPNTCQWIPYSSQEGQDYWAALQYISRWTKANHTSIHNRVLNAIHAKPITSFGNEHNFVWRYNKKFMHGKGATPAWREADGRKRMGLIPLNMGAPILWVAGGDNDEYLSFAPHGAGRNVSRTQTLAPFKDDPESLKKEIDNQTQGVYVRWYSDKPDLSETPLGYKSATQIKQQIEQFDLADVIAEIRPMGCIMAGEQDRPWRRNK